jgi:hypothetical protein
MTLEGKGVAGAEDIPERLAPVSGSEADFEEHDFSALCILGDNTSSVSAVRKGVSGNPVMQRCLDGIMASCVTADFGAFTFHLPGWHMEGNGIDDISRGKAEKLRLMGTVGLNVTANQALNPFSQQDWGLPEHIRTLIEEKFGSDVMYFACGNGLTVANCANAVVCIYPTPSIAVQFVGSGMRGLGRVPAHDGADHGVCEGLRYPPHAFAAASVRSTEQRPARHRVGGWTGGCLGEVSCCKVAAKTPYHHQLDCVQLLYRPGES